MVSKINISKSSVISKESMTIDVSKISTINEIRKSSSPIVIK